MCSILILESNRAKVYRKLNQIPSDWGTAVNVQSMVFGNMGDDCLCSFYQDPLMVLRIYTESI